MNALKVIFMHNECQTANAARAAPSNGFTSNKTHACFPCYSYFEMHRLRHVANPVHFWCWYCYLENLFGLFRWFVGQCIVRMQSNTCNAIARSMYTDKRKQEEIVRTKASAYVGAIVSELTAPLSLHSANLLAHLHNVCITLHVQCAVCTHPHGLA